MGIDGAKALAAKVLSDEVLAKQINDVKTETEYFAVAAQLGYICTVDEFQAAYKEAKAKLPLSDDQLNQAAGGVIIIGLDNPCVPVIFNI